MSSLSRAGTALTTAALVLCLAMTVGAAHAGSPKSAAGRGGTWLSRQIDARGLVYNRQYKFNDYGLTADTVLGLKAVGGHPRQVAKARLALAHHVDGYTAYHQDRYAGATAKLLVVAEQTGANPRHFGSVNLVKRLAALVATKAPVTGRIEDRAATDFANTIGQVFAARGLVTAHHPLAASVVRFLLEQQCDSGYFRVEFNADKTATNQACTRKSPADTDVTALAVVELAPVAKGHPALTKALARAIVWLRHHQKNNGSFGGGPSTSAPNANSTGLAAWALGTSGRCHAAADAAAWVARLQVGGHLKGTALAGESGAIAYDRAALTSARRDGITKRTRDQWRRATAQAAPGLLFLAGHHCR